MTQEDKKLLLVDLCARLPYGIIVQVPKRISINDLKVYGIETPYRNSFLQKRNEHYLRFWNDSIANIDECKPYLRPMSSMTDEERKEYNKTLIPLDYYDGDTIDTFDWLNTNHFDYRDLISKGLAIEVTEENNPYKE